MSTLKRKVGTDSNGVDSSKKPKQDGSIMSFFGAPKTAGANGSTSTAMNDGPPAPKFDKAKWVASLTPEQRTLLKLEIDTMDESWLAHLKDELVTSRFLDLKRFLDNETKMERQWFPPKEDVYSWSRYTPLHKVRVVILGQDPYHNYNQAHGLAFSVRPPIPAPPSLKNMYIALRNDYPNGLFNPPPPSVGGLLTPWAERGVLLLNTCLTVRAHEPKSHAEKGWERLTARAIEAVEKVHSRRGVVFMAWGTPAQKVVSKVDAKKHLVLKAVHPSPLSAARGFFDCGHFKKANEWLKQRYGEDGQVDWALVPGESVLGRKKEEKKDAEGAKKLQGVVATVDEKEKAQDELEVDDVDWAALDEMNKAEAEAEKKAAKAEVDADKKEDPAKAEAEADAEKKEEEAKGEALVDVKA